MTIVTDVLVSLAVGLGLALAIVGQPGLSALRPSSVEIKRSVRTAAIAKRSAKLLRGGFLWLSAGLALFGFRSLPGGVPEIIGGGAAAFGYFLIVGSIVTNAQWRSQSGRRRS